MTVSTSRRTAPRRSGLLLVGVLIAVMWVAEVVDTLIGGRLDGLGIEPRELDGLTGVVLAPFLHGGFGHLIANTVPFAVLGALIALSGMVRIAAVTAIVTVVGGLATWLVAPDATVHIGASGVVFGYATYLISRGVFTRRVWHIAVGLLVGMLYGGSVLIGLVPRSGISWQGHLFGALAGVLAAWLLARRVRPAGRAAARAGR